MEANIIYKGVDLGITIEVTTFFGGYIIPERIRLPNGAIWYVDDPENFELEVTK